MNIKEFFGKFVSKYILLNLMAMAILLALIVFGVKYGLDEYTRHGEEIEVPDLYSMTFLQAKELLELNGMTVLVSDSGHNKKMAAGCVLAQNPKAGSHVKSGRIIYVTLNSPSSPTFAIPDIIDNSSYREAEAKLTAMGFRLLAPKYIAGEKDWVYGVVSRGRNLGVGDQVSIDVPLQLVVGNGGYEGNDVSIDYKDADYMGNSFEEDVFEEVGAGGATESDPLVDDFEEVKMD